MLLYYLFWMILGFIMHFYIIFGTNLLTQSPVPVPVFSVVSVFQRKGISNGVETKRNQLEKLFLEGKLPEKLGVHVRKEWRCPRGWGRPPLLGCAPCLVGPPKLHRCTSCTHIYSRTLKLSEQRLDRESARSLRSHRKPI